MMKKPWERRLNDLSYALRNCASTYFEPELFRRNINHFLQTSRTVTFIIQKEKSNIPDFDNWYDVNVLDRIKSDRVMKWAKDARNKIEKQGDLEMHSKLEVALMSSYFNSEDYAIEISRNELLNAGVEKLIKHCKTKFPEGFETSVGIKIERRWVCNELDSIELIQALSYTYSRLYECCQKLAEHLESSLSDEIPNPVLITEETVAEKQVKLVKISDMSTYSIATIKKTYKRDDFTCEQIAAAAPDSGESVTTPYDLQTAIQFHEHMATKIFNKYDNHKNTLFFLNDEWVPMFVSQPFFSDRIDKYFFWRMTGEQAYVIKPNAVVFVGESWIREKPHLSYPTPIDEWPIKGERLKLCAVDRFGNSCSTEWAIERHNDKPSQLGLPERAGHVSEMVFLNPVLDGMGVDPELRQPPN